MGGRRGRFSAELFHAAERASAVTGLVTLPAWMAITCATTGRTTQTSASTLVTDLGANAARARNVGSGWGLSMEMARTNLITYANDGNQWNTNGGGSLTSINSLADPAGGTLASLGGWVAAAGDAVYFPPAVPNQLAINQAGISTLWALPVTGTQFDIFDINSGAYTKTVATTSGWGRQEIACPSVHAGTTRFCAGNKLGGAGGTSSQRLYGVQVEGSVSYPSSLIVSAGSATARAADVLAVGAPARLAPGGFFDLDMTVAPNYTQAEQAADHNLVYFDANNRVYVKQSNSTVVLRIGGVDLASSALTWSREAAIRIQAQHRAGGRRLIVTGATTGNGDSAIQSASAAITLPATGYLMGSNTGAEECADLRDLLVYRP